jgi:hypothetical protein
MCGRDRLSDKENAGLVHDETGVLVQGETGVGRLGGFP